MASSDACVGCGLVVGCFCVGDVDGAEVSKCRNITVKTAPSSHLVTFLLLIWLPLLFLFCEIFVMPRMERHVKEFGATL